MLALLNEGYDLKQATTFVENHLQSSARQRIAVMWSLSSHDQLAEREKKRVKIDSMRLSFYGHKQLMQGRRRSGFNANGDKAAEKK